ncbi:twin-arginine translocase TatA/TatE family subunit [Hufsiella ginkgonis]|uniref:twin-arginine translocase TatA/TatE family subunit n=1 Tax=Hufsiella ginkgonis TaxID=2695274 RepID=UPI001F0138DB|nr:twin-arginine translocase TatA/TatE family subunit [Hufsiella ginkgonis]
MQSSVLLFINVGGPEMMMIMFVALLLFGGKKLPELARGLGKGIREFKDASDGVKREIQRNINAAADEIDLEKERESAYNKPEQSPYHSDESQPDHLPANNVPDENPVANATPAYTGYNDAGINLEKKKTEPATGDQTHLNSN